MKLGKYADVKINEWSHVYASGKIVDWDEIGIGIEKKNGDIYFMPWFSVNAVEFWDDDKKTNKVGQSEPVDTWPKWFPSFFK